MFSSSSRGNGKVAIARGFLAVGVVIAAAAAATILLWQLGAVGPAQRDQSAPAATSRAASLLTDAEVSARCAAEVERPEIGTSKPRPGRLRSRLVVHSVHGELAVFTDQRFVWVCRLGTTNEVLPPTRVAAVRAVATGFAVLVTRRSDSPGDLVWSGGALPQGVTSVTYRFSDGHRESAVTKGGFWVMEYESEAPLAHAPGEQASAPIAVTLAGPEGLRRLTVTWEDYCSRGARGMSVAMGC